MRYPLEALLDACVAQLNNGEDLEEVLAGHPEVADELRPLLAAAAWARIDVPPPRHRAEGKARLMRSVAARRRVVESVDGYITEIKAGVPIRELLSSAPAHLRPALVAAWRMRDTEAPVPSSERMAEGKEALMSAVAARRAARADARRHALRGAVMAWLVGRVEHVAAGAALPPTGWRRLRTAMVALTLTAAIALGMTGVTGAAAASLPGQPFYGVKRLGESAQLVFTFDPARRAELSIAFADRRLDEMRRLAVHGQDVPAKLVDDWLRMQQHAWTEIRRLPMDQRELLAEILLDSAQDAKAAHLQGAVAADALASMNAGSDALAETVRASIDGDTAATPDPSADRSDGGPMAVERPLPRDDAHAADEPASSHASEQAANGQSAGGQPAQGSEAGAPASPAEPAMQPPAAPQPRADDHHGDDNSNPPPAADPGDNPPPTSAADNGPSEPPPPVFGAPPLGTATPSPTPPPADGNGPGDTGSPTPGPSDPLIP